MRHYGYIGDGPVLIERFEQAERVTDPFIPDGTGIFDNAVDLDEFYIAAHAGVDHETGEVVDEVAESVTGIANGLYYPFAINILYNIEWE